VLAEFAAGEVRDKRGEAVGFNTPHPDAMLTGAMLGASSTAGPIQASNRVGKELDEAALTVRLYPQKRMSLKMSVSCSITRAV
jgi:hypothetical protein